jgi:hypothetical protein
MLAGAAAARAEGDHADGATRGRLGARRGDHDDRDDDRDRRERDEGEGEATAT